MKLKPLHDNVLLEVYEEKKDVSIIIPDNVYDDEVAVLGRILDVADGITAVKKDDIVTFKKHLFDEVAFSDKEIYFLGKVENITAIFNPNKVNTE